jgi:hypothetical protein
MTGAPMVTPQPRHHGPEPPPRGRPYERSVSTSQRRSRGAVRRLLVLPPVGQRREPGAGVLSSEVSVNARNR